MKRSLIVSMSVALLGALVFAFSSRRPIEPARFTPSNEELFGEIQALKDEVRRLKTESRAPLVPLPTEPAIAPVAAASATEPVLEEADKHEQTPRQRQQQTATDLDVRMAKEPADAAWGRQVTFEIREAVGAGAPSARVVEAECASSLCRVVLTHDSPNDQKGLGEALASLGPFRHGVFFDYDEDSVPPSTSIYVIREGRSFRDDE